MVGRESEANGPESKGASECVGTYFFPVLEALFVRPWRGVEEQLARGKTMNLLGSYFWSLGRMGFCFAQCCRQKIK